MRRVPSWLAALLLTAGLARGAAGEPRDVAGAVEVVWKDAAPDGGVIAGRVSLGGVPTKARIEVRQLMTQQEALAETGNLVRLLGSVLHDPERAASAGLAFETGAAGAFRVRALPAGVYVVRTPGLGGRATALQVAIAGPGSGMRADIDVPKGPHTIRGRVVGARGEPKPATLLLRAPITAGTAARTPVVAIPVAADGTFALTGLPAGDYQFHALDPADGSMRIRPVTLPMSEPLRVSVGPVVTLRGRVVDLDGAPVPKATLRVLQHIVPEGDEEEGYELAEATCGDDGAFTWPCAFHPAALTAFAPGRGRAQVRVDDPVRTAAERKARERFRARLEDEARQDAWADEEWEGETAPESADALRDEAAEERPAVTEVLEIRLTAGGRISGRAVDGERGVAGVRVAALSLGGLGSDPMGLLDRGFLMTVTGDDGGFVLPDVAPGDYVLVGEGAGWCSQDAVGLTPNPMTPLVPTRGLEVASGADVRADVPVVRMGALEGRVTRAGGGPVVDALVAWAPDAGPGLPSGLQLVAQLGMADGSLTGSDGRFTLTRVGPDTAVRVACTGPGGTLGLSAPIAVAAGARREIDVIVQRPIFASLRVTFDVTGEPVADARVRMDDQEGAVHPALALQRWTTDADGRARVGPLPAEGATLRVVDLSRPFSKDASVQVPASDPLAPLAQVEAHMPPPGRASGRVEGPAGAPLEAVHFEFVPEGDEERFGPDLALRMSRRHVAADGTFEIECPEAGRRHVVASLRWQGEYYEAATVADLPAKGLRLTLARPTFDDDDPRVLIRVRDAAGRVVPRAAWRVLEWDEAVAEQAPRSLGGWRASPVREGVGLIDPRAHLHLSGDPPAPYYVEVWNARDSKGPLPLGAVRLGPLPARGGVHEIRLPAERRLTVRMLDAQGAPVPHAAVAAALVPLGADPEMPQASWPDRSMSVAAGRTSADGTVVLAGLGADAVQLRMTPPEGFVTPEPVLVPADRAAVEVRLLEAISVVVTVVGPDGAPIEGAEVEAHAHVPPEPEPERPAGEQPDLPEAEAWRRHALRAGRAPLASARSDADGRAPLVGLAPAVTYDLVVDPGFRRRDLKRVEVTPWTPADSRVALGDGGGIRVRVRTKQGKPAESFTLWSNRLGAWDEVHLDHRRPDGTVTLRTYFDEPVLLLATPPGRRPPTSQRALADWERRAVRRESKEVGVTELVVAEGVTWKIRLRGMDPGASVMAVVVPDPTEGAAPRPARRRVRLPSWPLLGDDEPAVEELTAQDGVVTVTDADPEEAYLLHAVSDDGFAAVRRGLRVTAEPLEIDLTPVVPLSGRLVPPPTGDQQALVECAEPGLVGGLPVEADGSFFLGGLPAGRWRLRALVQEGGLTVRERVFYAEGEVPQDVATLEGSVEAALEEAFGYSSYFHKKTRDEKLALYDRVLAIEPAEPNAGVARAALRQEARDLAGAREDLDHVLAVWPHDPKALRQRARVRWEAGDREGSVADRERALARQEDPYERYALAWSYDQMSDLEAALRHAERGVELYPRHPDLCATRAELRRQRDGPEAGLRDAEDALARFPDHALVQAVWCRAVRRLGRGSEVLARIDPWLDAAVESQGRNLRDLRWERALARLEAGDGAGAEADMAADAGTDPGGAWAPVLWVARARAGDAAAATEIVKGRLDGPGRDGLGAVSRHILEHLAGRRSAEDLLAAVERQATERTERRAALRAQAWYYVAERRHADGDAAGARAAYEAVVATKAEGEWQFTLALNALAATAAPARGSGGGGR